MEYQKAVDTILQFANETPVNAPNEHPLQGVIENYLNNTVTREQVWGWWFNEDHNLTLQADEEGKVTIAPELNKIVFDNPDYVERGDLVYDKVNNTYLIGTEVLIIESTRVLEWVKLPELMQQWCMFQAAKYYILSTIGDAGIKTDMKEEAARTLVMLKAEDLRSRNINIFNTPNIAKYKVGRQPYIRRY